MSDDTNTVSRAHQTHQTTPQPDPRTELGYAAARLEVARAELRVVREQREILRTLMLVLRNVAKSEAAASGYPTSYWRRLVERIDDALRLTE